MAAQLEKEKEEKRLKEIEEERNKKELAEYEWKMSGKKRKHKERTVVGNQDRGNWFQRYRVPILSVTVVIAASTYFLFNV